MCCRSVAPCCKARPRRWPTIPTCSASISALNRLETGAQPAGEEVRWPTVGVVVRIDQELVVGGGDQALDELAGVIRFYNVLRLIGQSAVAHQHAPTTGARRVA